MLTVYKVKGKKSDAEYLFKYDLNGNLKLFEIIGAPLTDEQIVWFFRGNKIPSREQFMIDYWMKLPEFKNHFEIIKVPADLSFDNLWQLYNYKVSKADAEKAFAKLKDEADVIKCFLGIKPYEEHLAKTKTAKAHLSRYINGRYFENEY